MLPDDIDGFRRRLAETIAWCAPRASLADPENCLRTPALRPVNWSERLDPDLGFEYRWEKLAEDEAVFSILAERRADLLRQENSYPSPLTEGLAGGRLLIADPRNSDTCYLSAPETGGFFDEWDVPPWGTWIDGMDGVSGTILFCWIPPVFIKSVERGILVNPAGCIFWASDYREHGYPGMLFRELEEARLLLRPYEQ